MLNLKVFMYPVGFHRYALKNFTGETLDGLNEVEVEEFDPPHEVSSFRTRFCLHGHMKFMTRTILNLIIITAGPSIN